jgi:hypothetical protein
MASQKTFTRKSRKNSKTHVKTRKNHKGHSRKSSSNAHFRGTGHKKSSRKVGRTRKGGWGFGNNTTDMNTLIQNNSMGRFVVKGDAIILQYKYKQGSENDYYYKTNFRGQKCEALSYSKAKECSNYKNIYRHQYAKVIAYDRGDNDSNNFLKVYFPEDKFTMYPNTITVNLTDFIMVPVQRTDEEKRMILQKDINANLLAPKKV